LELQRLVNNKIESVFLHYAKRIGTAEKMLKARTLNGALWRIWNCRENFENKKSKGCILMVFGTATKILKTRTVKGAFWRHLEQQRNIWKQGR